MIYIGTCGYFYKSAVGEFYPPSLPAGRFFEYYASFFNSLELNSTFYRFPKKSTVKSWKYKLKKFQNFKLSIKANRHITHIRKLQPESRLFEFLSVVKELENNLGAVLFQLPPSLKYNEKILKIFCAALDKELNYAIEFRNESWHRKEVYELLKKENIAFVSHDYNQNFHFIKTADFEYIRLHGFKERYKTSYPESFLKNLAAKIQNGFVYFNNTADNSAFKDALRLKKIIEEKN